MEIGKLFCVVVTYNGIAWTDWCLDSLMASDRPVKVIVIDNASTDGTPGHIRKKFPSVRLIESPVNLGFGNANNEGIRMALREGADMVFLLNQDAAVERDTLSKLVRTMRSDPQLGIVSPMHLNGTGSAPDRYFEQYLRKARSEFHAVPSIAGAIPVGFVNAAAWLISGDCLNRTGGFDPIFYHYGEDINYCHRAAFNGFGIAVCPDTRIFHDREERLASPVPAGQARHRTWIHLLTRACDVRETDYKFLLSKRIARSILEGGYQLARFNRSRAADHFFIAGKIYSSFARIGRSRRQALKPAAYL